MECKHKKSCGHDYCNLDECPEFEQKTDKINWNEVLGSDEIPVKIGDVLGVTYSDGNDTIKILHIQGNILVVAKNFNSDFTDKDIAVAKLPNDTNIAKIKIKGVWLDYQILKS